MNFLQKNLIQSRPLAMVLMVLVFVLALVFVFAPQLVLGPAILEIARKSYPLSVTARFFSLMVIVIVLYFLFALMDWIFRRWRRSKTKDVDSK
jgi:cytochrome c biogenesis factor